jgi:DNA-binding YbaB/EbfC family protein
MELIVFDPRKLFDMMKNASELQKNMAEKLKQQKATGEAAGGMVKVMMNGHFEVESISFEDGLLKEDKAFIEEVTKAAVNDATSQLRNSMAEYIKSFTGSLGL